MSKIDNTPFLFVIKYETNKTNLVTNTNHDYTTYSDPLLVMDEVVNESVRKSNAGFKGASFLAIESDVAYIPTVTGATAGHPKSQTENVLIKGFDNKYVSRMLVAFTPRTAGVVKDGDAVHASGFLGSYSSINSKMQFRVNGVNRLAGDGITRPNQRLACLNDTWGNCDAVPGGNDIGVFSLDDYTLYGGANDAAKAANKLKYTGTADYHGILLASRIQDLQIQFTRDIQFDQAGNAAMNTTQFNDALRMTVFGEVQKSIVPRKGGGYDIKYL